MQRVDQLTIVLICDRGSVLNQEKQFSHAYFLVNGVGIYYSRARGDAIVRVVLFY